MGCQRYPDYISIDRSTILNDTIKRFSINRGVLILNKKYTLPSYCPVIGNKPDVDWLKYGSRNEENITVGDIKKPFVLKKKKGENYILLIKSKDSVKFELLEF